MKSKRKLLMAAMGCGLWLLAASAWAQSTEAGPPDRVARLAVIDGSANFMPAGSQQWGDASINRPLVTGDKVWVPTGSRVSLELGGTEIRLDGDSGFGFLHLGNDTAQAQLTSGTLNLNVRHLYRGQDYEIDTPTLALVVDRVGQYRVDIAPGGKGTQVTVFSGEALVYGEGGAQRRVSAGNSYRFLDSSLTQVEVFPVPRPDSFDRWCFARDARYQRDYGSSANYVSTEVIGYQDLSDYGTWANETDYGPVWFPTAVPVGWAPYRFGHWAWVPPWGWTWIDDAPWGFAPFHYGRWAYVGGRWGWLPGPMAVRPVYAPALVAFVGFGSGWGSWGGWNAGFGGPVGWYPLAPGAVFVPWYRCGPHYFRNVNVTNINIVNQTVINNINTTYGTWRRGGPLHIGQLGDQRIPPRALTVVPKDVFVHARPVGPHNLQPPVPVSTALRGPVALAAPPAPGRGSLMAPRSGPAPNVPRPIFAREVLAHRAPPRTIAVLPQSTSGYRLATGGAMRFVHPPARLAGNVRVIGGPRRGPLPPMQGVGTLPSVPRIERAPTALGQRMNAPGTGLVHALPSARFAPHRWQPATLPSPARIGLAGPSVGGYGQPQIRRENGAQIISGSPRPPAGHFEPAVGGRALPRGPGATAGWRSARPREPSGGMQVIQAPRPQWNPSGGPRGPVPAAGPSYGPRPGSRPPPQFNRAPPSQFGGMRQQPFQAPPQRFEQPPPQQFRQAPQFRPAPAPMFRPAPQAQPAPREIRRPPHGGG